VPGSPFGIALKSVIVQHRAGDGTTGEAAIPAGIISAVRRIAVESSMSLLSRVEERVPWLVKSGRLTWIAKYAGLCIGLLVLVVILFRHVLGLDILSYTDSIGIAAVLGLLGVIALGVGLMAATFYSARSGMDEHVGEARDISRDDQG
jgi:hypothetical protein